MTNKRMFLAFFILISCFLLFQSYSIFTGKKKAVIQKSGIDKNLINKITHSVLTPSITSPSQKLHFVGDSITIKGTALGDMQKIQVRLDSGDWVDLPATSNWETTFTPLAIGPHYAYVRTVFSNQISSEASVQFNVEKIFGGIYNDFGYYGQQTTDGGYILLGDSYSFSYNPCLYMVKADSAGNKLWKQIFAHDGDPLEATYIQQTMDEGYIILGYRPGSVYDYLAKTDPSGNILWHKIWTNNFSWARTVQQTADKGYIITGDYNTNGGDIFLLKTSTNGSLKWRKTYGGSDEEAGYFVIQDRLDKGYVFTGYTKSYGAGGCNVFVVKVNTNGNTMWSNVIGGNDDDIGRCIRQTSDGGYIIVGRTISYGEGGYDVYLIKLNPSGAVAWTKTFGGPWDEYGSSIQQTSDGGYIIAGTTKSFGTGGYDVYLLKTDSLGNEMWHKTFGGSGDENYDDTIPDVVPCTVQQTSDGGYFIIGSTKSFGINNSVDFYMIKTDANGD